MRMFILFLGITLLSNVASAGDISGTVTVLEKGGKKPLKSFANAVVYIEGLETPAPAEQAILNQKKKSFQPRLLPIVTGQEVLITNEDRLLHNAFSLHEEEPFDVGRYGKGKSESVVLKVLGPHKVYCNIHQRMIADIFVLPNRYFGVTDKKGTFTIKDIPAGEYTIKVWHIYGGADEQVVQVKDQAREVNFSVTSQKKLVQLKKHMNKHKMPYRSDGNSSSGGSY